ncbi:hypothetical protein B566_EDAN001838 [Ephemera danica]|nr:hypothetical protein B566_EDAN001838 [Ephemera danica]
MESMQELYYLWTLNIVFTCCFYWYKYQKKKNRRPCRRFAVRPVLQTRKLKGEFATFFKEIKDDDPEYFFKYTRMSRDTYLRLLQLVGPKLQKKCRTGRKIPAEERLAFTLRYLSTGDSQLSCSWTYRIGRSTASMIIQETTVLQPLVLEPPTRTQWKAIADEYLLFWNLAHCCGGIDGKYIYMQAPPNTGSIYFCHKSMFALVMMALCDARYRFIWVDIGAPGSESDGGILQRSDLGLALHNRMLNLPAPDLLPNSNVTFPYYFVGDEAFPLGPSLMRPYPGKFLEREKKVFNYRLSRARRTIENAFGIFVARWRIFKKPIQATTKTVTTVTKGRFTIGSRVK